jgi:hypothetical protein
MAAHWQRLANELGRPKKIAAHEGPAVIMGRGLHSSTFQLNLRHF